MKPLDFCKRCGTKLPRAYACRSWKDEKRAPPRFCISCRDFINRRDMRLRQQELFR